MKDREVLKPCPCGQVPDDLDIVDAKQGGKLAYTVPACCGEWTIEFHTQYHPIESDNLRVLAIQAWNDAHRASKSNAIEVIDRAMEVVGANYHIMPKEKETAAVKLHNSVIDIDIEALEQLKQEYSD